MDTKSFIDLVRVSRALSLLALTVGFFFLCLWTLCPVEWKEFAGLSMKPNTALGVSLAAIAMLLQSFEPKRLTKTYRSLRWILGSLVFVIGAATLLEYVFQRSLGIDEFIALDFQNAESSVFPGRMSPITAFGMALLGFSILVLRFTGSLAVVLQQGSALLLLLLGLFAIVGYLMGSDALYKVGPYIRISPYAAFTLMTLAVSGLFLRSRLGIMRLITSPTPGGMAIRHLLPTAFFLPLIIGWLRLFGQKSGYYGLAQGTSLSVISYIVLFSFLIYRGGRSLNLAYAEKEKTEKKFLEELEYHTHQLEKAIHARDEFLSVASHELKTPLTSLKLQVQMQKRKLVRQHGERSESEEPEQFFEIAERQVNRLARLIEDMLDIGRIESGRFRLNLEEFNLVDLVKEVAEQMAAEVNASGSELELKLPEKILVRADKVRLAQVLMNLLSNSCKYGGGKKIEISAYEQQSSDKVFLEVKDQGAGIALSDQERIFQRFERGVPGTHISGLGLGLFIVRKIVEQHKGKISVESELGQGARFTVEIPRELHESIAPEASISAGPRSFS